MANASRRRRGRGRRRTATAVLVGAAGVGCQAAPRNESAEAAFARFEFTAARAALREEALERNDEQVVLNNLRLGVAALADGALEESERALGRTFDLLSTAGLNRDRTTAAVFVHEGVRIWKGEPFEQALAYYYVSALYAVRDDWENARAAAANALFRLTDFGADQSAKSLATREADDPGYLEHGYTAVDTNFALGFLMQGIGASHSGASGSDAQLEAAAKIDERLAPLVAALRARAYDTLLIVDYGRGPAKYAYGPDDALAGFRPRDQPRGPILVRGGGIEASFPAACDVNTLALDHRWNNLEDVRKAKSAIGNVLLGSGAVVAVAGDRPEHALIAGGLVIGGLLLKSGARADTRYFEFAPQAVYLVPLRLGAPTDLHVEVGGAYGSALLVDRCKPGTTDRPRAIYLRLPSAAGPRPSWLVADAPAYGNDHTGVRPGDYPWILGGRDVSTPSRAVLEAYHANGYLADMTVRDLLALYDAEGVVIGAGRDASAGRARDPSWRHVLEGGNGLFTPAPDSPGYKRLMYVEHPSYQPRSALVRNAAERARVRP